ncbi:hypothetical protein EDB84DRAFT_1572823 [Lactarius hengduanensis]|nr:hypothetical protein EDB84DRAFT_1572823 [Lactarius hengduanensis]
MSTRMRLSITPQKGESSVAAACQPTTIKRHAKKLPRRPSSETTTNGVQSNWRQRNTTARTARIEPTAAPPRTRSPNHSSGEGDDEEFAAAANTLPWTERLELLMTIRTYENPSKAERWKALVRIKNRSRHRSDETRRGEATPAPILTYAPSPAQPSTGTMEEDDFIAAARTLTNDEREELIDALLEYDDPCEEERWHALSTIRDRHHHPKTHKANVTPVPIPTHTQSSGQTTTGVPKERNLAAMFRTLTSEKQEEMRTLLADDNLDDDELWDALEKLQSSYRHNTEVRKDEANPAPPLTHISQTAQLTTDTPEENHLAAFHALSNSEREEQLEAFLNDDPENGELWRALEALRSDNEPETASSDVEEWLNALIYGDGDDPVGLTTDASTHSAQTAAPPSNITPTPPQAHDDSGDLKNLNNSDNVDADNELSDPGEESAENPLPEEFAHWTKKTEPEGLIYWTSRSEDDAPAITPKTHSRALAAQRRSKLKPPKGETRYRHHFHHVSRARHRPRKNAKDHEQTTSPTSNPSRPLTSAARRAEASQVEAPAEGPAKGNAHPPSVPRDSSTGSPSERLSGDPQLKLTRKMLVKASPATLNQACSSSLQVSPGPPSPPTSPPTYHTFPQTPCPWQLPRWNGFEANFATVWTNYAEPPNEPDKPAETSAETCANHGTPTSELDTENEDEDEDEDVDTTIVPQDVADVHRAKRTCFTQEGERSAQPALRPQLAYRGRRSQLARRGRRPPLMNSSGRLAAQPPTDPEQPGATRPMVVEDHRSREGVKFPSSPLSRATPQHQHDSAAYTFPRHALEQPRDPDELATRKNYSPNEDRCNAETSPLLRDNAPRPQQTGPTPNNRPREQRRIRPYDPAAVQASTCTSRAGAQKTCQCNDDREHGKRHCPHNKPCTFCNSPGHAPFEGLFQHSNYRPTQPCRVWERHVRVNDNNGCPWSGVASEAPQIKRTMTDVDITPVHSTPHDPHLATMQANTHSTPASSATPWPSTFSALPRTSDLAHEATNKDDSLVAPSPSDSRLALPIPTPLRGPTARTVVQHPTNAATSASALASTNLDATPLKDASTSIPPTTALPATPVPTRANPRTPRRRVMLGSPVNTDSSQTPAVTHFATPSNAASIIVPPLQTTLTDAADRRVKTSDDLADDAYEYRHNERSTPSFNDRDGSTLDPAVVASRVTTTFPLATTSPPTPTSTSNSPDFVPEVSAPANAVDSDQTGLGFLRLHRPTRLPGPLVIPTHDTSVPDQRTLQSRIVPIKTSTTAPTTPPPAAHPTKSNNRLISTPTHLDTPLSTSAVTTARLDSSKRFAPNAASTNSDAAPIEDTTDSNDIGPSRSPGITLASAPPTRGSPSLFLVVDQTSAMHLAAKFTTSCSSPNPGNVELAP